eukprot:1195700-Prorocentrum_minimum.AAC.10
MSATNPSVYGGLLVILPLDGRQELTGKMWSALGSWQFWHRASISSTVVSSSLRVRTACRQHSLTQRLTISTLLHSGSQSALSYTAAHNQHSQKALEQGKAAHQTIHES